jgi:predicted  nucleic acid-binding Zn-ribbon protein
LHGCTCGSKFFFYLTQEKLDKIQNSQAPEIALSDKEKERIEEDVRDIIGISEDAESPVVMDFESIKVVKPGKYIIDLHNLFTKERPLVYTVEEGKYFVDLTSQILSKKDI